MIPSGRERLVREGVQFGQGNVGDCLSLILLSKNLPEQHLFFEAYAHDM